MGGGTRAILYCVRYGCTFSQEIFDPAMKQFLLYLDETNALGKKFIIQDLDETHVFVLAELVAVLQEKVGELMDQNSFPITQK
uniref:General transcription and DNA repair factor IIH subunit TFB5 n=1 Tax=Leptobrachium leishanense TaxID=445787 RepID=A0A8C5N4G6_9ANUR